MNTKHTKHTGRTILQAVLVLVLVALLALQIAQVADAAGGYGWGYPRERIIRRILTNFTRQMNEANFPAQFYFFEDGSWTVVGCLPGALCED